MGVNGKSQIVEWYRGKSIFLTGGTGFMGKVLIEKLLYSCYVDKIYILIRSKRGKTPQQRIDDMWKLPVFSRLKEVQPDAVKRMIPLSGDLNTDGLGLSQPDLDQLINNAQVVFHVGATLKLEATLRDAIEQNTTGTARVLDVVKQIKNLLAFVHFSTAYCSADIEVFEEKVYDCRDNPRDVIEVTKWINEDALQVATKALIAPHPNTYTYSKRLAEKLVANEAQNIPVCIVRPSVVTPSAIEPLPGWVDSLNGPMGLLVGAGKGVIRSMHVKAENRAQVIPVDAAIGTAIIVAQKLGSSKTRPKEVPVYNLTQDEVIRISMGEILDLGRGLMYEYPFEGQIWYPDGDIRSSYFIHYIFCIFLHWLPAYLIDFLMFIFRQKRFMVRIQRRIHDGLELLQFFTVREWIFRSSNFLDVINNLSEADKKVFPIDFHLISIEDYFKTSILGARQYLMKEKLETIPRCRIQQKILFVIHKLFIYSFYLFIIWLIISSSSTAKAIFDTVGSYIRTVPIIGHLVPIE